MESQSDSKAASAAVFSTTYYPDPPQSLLYFRFMISMARDWVEEPSMAPATWPRGKHLACQLFFTGRHLSGLNRECHGMCSLLP